jgi:hypothetical protein
MVVVYFIQTGRETWLCDSRPTDSLSTVATPGFDEEVGMPTNDAIPSPDRSVVVEIGPETTDEELDELADSLYEQMSGWLRCGEADDASCDPE